MRALGGWTTVLPVGVIFALLHAANPNATWLGLANIRESKIAIEAMVFGVFIGSSLWWLILSLGIGLWRKKLNNKSNIKWVNRISGALITIFGVITILLF